MKNTISTIQIGLTISNNLKKIGQNQTWLAKECEVTRSQICKIVHNKANPSLKLLSKMAIALNFDDGELNKIILSRGKR